MWWIITLFQQLEKTFLLDLAGGFIKENLFTFFKPRKAHNHNLKKEQIKKNK